MVESVKTILVRMCKALYAFISMCLFAACIGIRYYDICQLSALVFFVHSFYIIIFVILIRVYNGFDIGLSRVRILIYSQTLANCVTAGIAYLFFSLKQGKLASIPPFINLLVMQFLWNVIWSVLANQLYFYRYIPRRSIVIYSQKFDLQRLDEVFVHPKKFSVEKMIENPENDLVPLLNEIAGYDAFFLSGINEHLRNGILEYCLERNIRCYVAPSVGDIILQGAKHLELLSVPVLRTMRATPNVEYLFGKRCFDIIVSLFALIILSPLMLIVAIAIRLYDNGPVIYKQVRLTKNGKIFEIYKFRSMKVSAESDGVARLASEDDDRITPVGKVIRACRFDELPQLLNILKGDMSVVGPRPERPEIAAQYQEDIPAFSLRLQVKAGLTGLAQVFGRYNSDPYSKLEMDLMYINKMSFAEDLRLIFATVKILFMKESTQGFLSESIQKIASVDKREKI